MNRTTSCGLILLLIIYVSPSWSAVYKCTDANGQMSYQQQPCANNNQSSSQVQIEANKASTAKTSTQKLQGSWCTIYIDSYAAGEYQLGNDPVHWQEIYEMGEVKQNPGSDGEIWLRFALSDNRIIHRDYGNLRMAEYQIVKSSTDEIILQLLYLAPDGKPGSDEFYVMKKGLCTNLI